MAHDPLRTVVVSGGSRGIGRAVCLALAGPGTRVYFNYRSAAESRRRDPRSCPKKRRRGGLPFGGCRFGTGRAAVFRPGTRRDRAGGRSGQQRRHYPRRPVGTDETGGLGRGDFDQPGGGVQLHQGRGQTHDETARRSHRQHHLGGRGDRQCRPGQLRGVQGRNHRFHQVGGQRAGIAQHHRQCGGSRLRRDGHDRRFDR